MSVDSPPSCVGIVGVGAIGSGVAQLVSSLGARTVVVAPRPGGVERARAMLEKCYLGDVQRGRISRAEAEAGLARLHFTPYYGDLAGAEIVIESVPEDLALKQQVLAAVEAATGPDCIFGSNTSSIPIQQIAAGAGRPANVIGTHYFWPAHRYKLLEIAHAPTTSASTIDRTLALARWQGKTPLLVRDLPGFFTTRALAPYINEAVALVAEGAPLEAVDRAMIGFGFAMGPFKLMDSAGVETLARVGDSLRDHLGDRVGDMPRLWSILRGGHVGYKGGGREAATGFYLYPGGRDPDPRVIPLFGHKPGPRPSADEIALRPVYQMINEAAHCLAEGVVPTPEEADLGAVLGLGWPKARAGGPLAYARQAGPGAVVAQLNCWAETHGPRFTPSQALMKMERWSRPSRGDPGPAA